MRSKKDFFFLVFFWESENIFGGSKAREREREGEIQDRMAVDNEGQLYPK